MLFTGSLRIFCYIHYTGSLRIFCYIQEFNVRKVNCSCVYSAYTLKPVLSGWNLQTRIDASVFVSYPRKIKAFNFDQNISQFIFVKIDSMSGCDIRLVFTFPPKDSTLQYKKCVHIWNNFSFDSTLIFINSELLEDEFCQQPL